MIADPLVEAGHHRELDRHLQVDVAGGVALEDDLDELTVEVVEVRVHVAQRCRAGAVEVEVRLGRLLEQRLGLVAHLLDHAAQVRIELVPVDPSGRLADVDAQVRRALDVGDDLDRRHDGAEVDGDRRLQGDDPEAGLLEFDRLHVVGVVAEDHVLGALEVAARAGCR